MDNSEGVRFLRWIEGLPDHIDSLMSSEKPLAVKIGLRDRRGATILIWMAETWPALVPEDAIELVNAAHALFWIESRGELNWAAKRPDGYPVEPARYTPELYAMLREFWAWLCSRDWTAEETIRALDAAKFWTTVMACSVAPNGNTARMPVVMPAPARRGRPRRSSLNGA